MSIKIGVRNRKGISIMDVTGRITLGEETSALREAIRESALRGDTKILLNLAEVTYVDSSGIGVLISSFATVGSHGGEIKLLNLTKRVRDVLLMTKLLTVFQVFEDEEAAIASFPEVAAEPSNRG